MPSSSPPPPTSRARPLLGTFVSVQVRGVPDCYAHSAIDAAFAEVELGHRLMSFHEFDSDVSRINREAWARDVQVHPWTAEVLRRAHAIAAASDGAFDVTVAAELVERGLLPRPDASRSPDAHASWRDIEVTAGGQVRFPRPLWIDLGGIAKGYAVDRAIERLQTFGVGRACVNAGGDLRTIGGTERVALQPDPGASDTIPVIEIENASVASSGRGSVREFRGDLQYGPHVDGRWRHTVGLNSFVSVVAERCVIADALTKVVLALGGRSGVLLQCYGATAYVRTASHPWRRFGAEEAAA